MKKVKLILKEENIEYKTNKIKSAKDVIEFMNSIEQMNLLAEETTFLMCLNTKNEIVAYSEIAKGRDRPMPHRHKDNIQDSVIIKC